ncbi:MAG: phage tail assembly chaperone [Janthinobacterium lividum]
MSEKVEVGGNLYRIGRMDVRKQFHVARRIGPAMLGFLGGSMVKGAQLSTMIGPVVDALSKMSDEDSDYVIDRCLAVVARAQNGGEWARVTAPDGGLMFQDIDLPQMLKLAQAVLAENLRGFFPIAVPASNPVQG